jgi:hypothetical protein
MIPAGMFFLRADMHLKQLRLNLKRILTHQLVAGWDDVPFSKNFPESGFLSVFCLSWRANLKCVCKNIKKAGSFEAYLTLYG